MTSDPHQNSWQAFQSLLEADLEADAPPLTYTWADFEGYMADESTQGWPDLVDGLASNELGSDQAFASPILDPQLHQVDTASISENTDLKYNEEGVDQDGVEVAIDDNRLSNSNSSENNAGEGSKRQGKSRASSAGGQVQSSPSAVERNFHCPEPGCERSFQYPKDLRRHAIVHQSHRQALFYCPYVECEYAVKGFPRKDTLKRHLKNVHSKESSDIA